MTDPIWAGLRALEEYVALHVLTCLVPAFLLAGAMVTFVSRDTILRYLGTRARMRWQEADQITSLVSP